MPWPIERSRLILGCQKISFVTQVSCRLPEYVGIVAGKLRELPHGPTASVVPSRYRLTILWPVGIAATDFGAPSFPAPATLALVQPAGGPDACIPGIALEAAQITIAHGSPAVTGTTIDLGRANLFRVRPVNGLSFSLPESAFVATVRIADWGPVAGASPTWRTVPGCGAAQASGYGSVASQGQLDLSCTWTLTTEEKCKYGRALLPSGTCTSVPATDDRNSHQSVLVELRPAVGAIPPAGSFFSVQSAAVDVDFVVVP
jgi:hypothetical protein